MANNNFYFPGVDKVFLTQRDGTADNPYLPLSQTSVVKYGKVELAEIPNFQQKVIVANSEGVALDEVTTLEIGENEFRVDYTKGVVFFNSSQEENTFTFSFLGMGRVNFPASRITIDTENNNEAELSIQQLLDSQGNIGARLTGAQITMGNIENQIVANEIVKAEDYQIDKEEVNSKLSETANYIAARSLSGVTGGEKIQNALNSNFPFTSPNKTIVIDGKGIDENGYWVLNEPLKIPSNTTLLLNGCYIRLGSQVNTHIIQNEDFENGNENIHVIVQGKVIFDCNQANQDFTNSPSYQKLGIHFYNVTHFSIRGVTIKDPYKQGLVLEKCKYGVVDDIYFDTQGLLNQDGVHILGPSSNIIVTNIRGIVGDDALVVNSRTNPAQGYGGGGDVTDIIFDDIVISGGTADNGGAHTGLLRTAPGADFKIENISLSNAIGHNLKDAILRLGGNETAPIENHKNVSVINVKGFEGTSGSISLGYMTTPVKDLKIDGVIIETTNDYLFTNRGLDINGLQISNVTRKVRPVSGEAVQQSSIELINANIKNIQIDNIYDSHESVSTEFLLSIAGSAVENIQVSKVIAKNIRKYLDTTNANVSNVRYDEIVLNTSDAVAYGGITGDKDVVVNKYAIETSSTTSKTPTRTNYQTGDAVLYRQSETSPYTLYFKDHANGWRRIDNEIINGIRLTIDFGTIPANTAKTIDVPYASSDNSIFYQVKPSFNLPINVLFSVQNYAAGKIRITVLNANPTDVTFSSQDWLAVGTQAKF
ncbi:hypothetical protein WKH57_00765 [Niallia taxi]|uniref:hypothetical protein n=1 Tax=Niallia taxi TaxID=2499688 RepID=UPI00317F91CD